MQISELLGDIMRSQAAAAVVLQSACLVERYQPLGPLAVGTSNAVWLRSPRDRSALREVLSCARTFTDQVRMTSGSTPGACSSAGRVQRSGLRSPVRPGSLAHRSVLTRTWRNTIIMA